MLDLPIEIQEKILKAVPDNNKAILKTVCKQWCGISTRMAFTNKMTSEFYTSSVELLKWARNNGCPWNQEICASAARGGHLEGHNDRCIFKYEW